jgi:hypothetical protein
VTVYDIGDLARLSLALTDVTGVAAAGTVVLTVTDPAGTATTPSLTNPSTGAYYADVEMTAAGTWTYRWTSTGAVVAAEDGELIVEANLSRRLYCTVAELKAQMAVTDTVDDALFEQAIRASSRAIDELCNRRFYAEATATARVYRADNCDLLRVDDISSLTGLVVKTDTASTGTYGQTLTITTDFVTEPSNAIAMGEPVKAIRHVNGTFPTGGYRPRVEVTAKWGWPVVPEQVRAACLVKAARLFRRKDSPEGIAGVSDFGVVRISRFEDPDVVMLLAPFMPGPLVA